jgi:hypothetical protein
VLLLVMALLPQGQEIDSAREVVDFVYSLFIFLLLTVLMLGSLAAMLLLGSGYVEALLQTMLVTGVVLMLLGVVANPRSGFAGIGGLISRYLMSIGLPVEQWLQALSNLALEEEDPHAFLEKACVEIAQRLPWVKGGEWIAGRSRGSFGVSSGRRWEFSHGGLVLMLYTQHAPSPTLIWHYNLLAQLLAQFHADKQRAQALRQLSYMRAIHETGARLTHDVKNLLQSLNALCSAGIEPGAEASPGVPVPAAPSVAGNYRSPCRNPGQAQCAARRFRGALDRRANGGANRRSASLGWIGSNFAATVCWRASCRRRFFPEYSTTWCATPPKSTCASRVSDCH